MDFLNIKFLFYIAFIVLGYIKSISSQERKYLLFSLLGILDICTNLLDIFIFTSNLELLIVNNLLTLGSYFVFFYFIKNITISPKLLFSVYGILLIYAGILFIFDWPKASSDLYSDYGYLNTFEYSFFCFFAAIICLTFCTFILTKIFQDETFRLNLLLIIFGIITYYVGDILKFGLGIHFLNDINVHNEFLNTFLPIRLYASKGLIIVGLIWKN